MKNLHLIVVSLLSTILFTGCDKLEDILGKEENPNNPQIEMNTPEVLFTTDGGNNTILFTTNEAWTAQVINSRADDWCNIHPTSGPAGDATIIVTTTHNDTPDDRTASIVIKAGTASKTVTVSQKQKDALTVTSSKFEIEAEGGEVKIEVKANIDFEYAIDESAKEWIKYEGTRAMNTSTLTFSVAENDDTKKREGKIAIKSGEFNEVVTIYQAGEEPSIIISKNEYVVSSNSETIAVEVTSNVDVTVELPADADWISENTTRATSTNTYYFDIQPNEDYVQRSAEIKFTNKENGLTETVKVVQIQKDALIVAKESYTISSDGGQIEIEVGHNVDFDIEIANDWITKAETRAFMSETLVFNIAKNTSYDNREGTIVFKSKDGSLSQTVKVYQAQEDALIISKKDIVIGDMGGTFSFELQTNVDFKVSEPNVYWLHAVTTRGLTTHTLCYIVDANTSYDSREAKVVVTDTKNNKSESITITQVQKDALVVAKDSYTINSEGGQIQIEVGHNIDFDVEISVDWITKTESTRAFTTEMLSFNIAENVDYDKREGEIVFKSKDGKLSQIVKVYQTQEDLKIAYSTDMEELDDWAGGLFGGKGTYILGKPHGDNGFLMTIGNILEEENAIVFMDKNKQIREIYIDDLVFILEDNVNDGVDISIIEKGCEIKTEHIILESRNYVTRASRSHSQQVGIINLTMNLQGMYEAIKEIENAKGFSKKGIIMFLANKTDAIRNTVKALGGPDIFNDTFSTWLGNGMNVVSLAELSALYGKAGTLGPAGACILAYAGLYTTYLELYDEHIESYFGSSQAEINNLTVKDYERLDIDVKVTGYEPWYNIECGVIVQENSFPAPSYSDGLVTKNVSQNGNYTFVKNDIKVNKTYYCRPFLIDKNKTSLWKGLIGDIVGPLVRYGEVKSVSVDILCSAITGNFITSTDKSAIVKCSYNNVNGIDGIECGVRVINPDTGEIRDIYTSNSEGEREINLTGLIPATTYTYNAYIKINNVIMKEGVIETFTTLPPDVTGTWNCRETHSKPNGEEYYTTYTVTLHKDGTVTTSKYDSFHGASWSQSKTGLSVSIRLGVPYFTGHYWAGSDTGHGLSITFDDPANPTSGKGYASYWAVSASTGIGSNNSYALEMTK